MKLLTFIKRFCYEILNTLLSIVLFRLSKQDILSVINLSKIQIKDRYLSSRLGMAWVFIQPLSFLLIYTVVFTFVFKSRIPGADSSLSFSVWLLSGMVPWLFISEAMSNGTNSFISFSAIIKNIVFKVELLPFVAVLTSFVQFAIGMVFLLGLMLINGNYPTWHYIFLPVVIAIQFLFFCGVSFFLGSAAVFFRDLIQIIPTFMQIMIFATPIFYSLDSFPPYIRCINFFNPFYQIVDPYRRIMIEHQVPDIAGFAYLAIVTAGLLFFGLRFCKQLRGFFSSAL